MRITPETCRKKPPPATVNGVTYLRDTWREKDNRKLKIPRNGGPTTGHADLKDTRNGGTTQPVES